MKKIIMNFIFLISFFPVTKGQDDYVIFSDDFISHQEGVSFLSKDNWYLFLKNKDTMINNMNYNRLFVYSWIINKGDTSLFCCYFIREDLKEKKIYLYDNIYNNQEILLYDFNLNLFDTILIRNFYPYYDSLYFHLYKVDSLNYNNQFFKRFWLKTHPTFPSTDTLHFQWAEKLGNLTEGGLFHYFKSYSPSSEAYIYPKGIFHYNKTVFCLDDTCATPPDTVLNFISNHITGYLFDDKNKNCIRDSGEVGIPNKTIEIQPGNYFVKTDSNGFFRAGVGKDSFTVSLMQGDSLWANRCNNNLPAYKISFNSYRNNPAPLYFGIDSLAVSAKNENYLKERLKIYPNPTTGKINLNFNATPPQPFTIELFSLLGIKVFSFNANIVSPTVILDLSALNNGIYFIKVKTSEGIALRNKLIKIR